jgi:hypothetical protein
MFKVRLRSADEFGNNRKDIRSRFLATMMGVPGQPMPSLVDGEELARRKDRRAPRPS